MESKAAKNLTDASRRVSRLLAPVEQPKNGHVDDMLGLVPS